MKLDKLRLKNYRGFEQFEIEFHKKLTVLIAPNGGGKTTILDAARVALWPFVKGFDLGSQTGKSASIQTDDVRLALMAANNMEPQTPSGIEGWGDWSETECKKHWIQQRLRMKKGTNTTGDAAVKKMTEYGQSLEILVRADQPVTLPLVTLLVSGMALFFRDFNEGARTLMGFAVLLVLLFYLGHLALSRLHPRLPLLLALPLLAMLSLSYAYGRVLTVQKAFATQALGSLAQDISAHRELREAKRIYLSVTYCDHWLTGAAGAVGQMPGLH